MGELNGESLQQALSVATSNLAMLLRCLSHLPSLDAHELQYGLSPGLTLGGSRCNRQQNSVLSKQELWKARSLTLSVLVTRRIFLFTGKEARSHMGKPMLTTIEFGVAIPSIMSWCPCALVLKTSVHSLRCHVSRRKFHAPRRSPVTINSSRKMRENYDKTSKNTGHCQL